MASRGKKFEDRFKTDWQESVPNSLCYRLYDTTSGFYGVGNVADFICYKYPCIYLIDTKSIQGNTLPFSDLRQFDKMLQYKNIKGAQVGFIVWFVDHDRVLWIPVQTMEKIKNEGLKSFNIRKMTDPADYFFLDISSYKLRSYMKSDYLAFTNFYNNLWENIDESRD